MQQKLNRIANLRHSMRLNQTDFAKKLGVTRQYVSLLESGAKPGGALLELVSRLEKEHAAAHELPYASAENKGSAVIKEPEVGYDSRTTPDSMLNLNPESDWLRLQADLNWQDIQRRLLILPSTEPANREQLVRQIDQRWEELKRIFVETPYRKPKKPEYRE